MAAAELDDPRDAAAMLLAEHGDQWVVELTDELERRLSGHQLERIMRRWQLSRTELGELFGVSRQAATKWLEGGVPADRVEQVADVQAITDLLEHHIERNRIAAVVRRRADGLGGTSLIELVSAGRGGQALVLTRRMFTFTDVHQ